MTKPAVNLHCVASYYAREGERIIEISFADGSGCLLSLTNGPPNKIEVYALTAEDVANIIVVAPDGCWHLNKEQTHE